MNFKKFFPLCMSIVITLWGCQSKNTNSTDANVIKKADTSAENAVSCPCEGMLQSPINIDERTIGRRDLPLLGFANTSTEMYVQNDHKAIKVAPVDNLNSSNYLKFNGQYYFLKDFHFHHKSEHLFNKIPDAMEMHVVYQNNQTKKIVVVGLLIRMANSGELPNPFLAAIWDEFPQNHEDYDPKKLNKLVNIARIINYNDADTYYYYEGSLTTGAPQMLKYYDQGITWLVFKKRLVLSKEQIIKFSTYYPNNARDTFPVNKRPVFRNK